MSIEPSVTWESDEHAYYTLIMTDPDAPTRESAKFREWLHWMVVNIPGDAIEQGDVKWLGLFYFILS
jgi:phosphatidylethanolamine-binding protein (PEBP) family uncharacterized protein